MHFATFVLSFASAQTVAEGINYLDSHKYAKAKEVFNQLKNLHLPKIISILEMHI